jgi:hypothetical protein
MKVLQNEKLVRFSKKTDCLCPFSFSKCNETTTSLGVSRAGVPGVVTTYTYDEKTSSAERTVAENQNYMKGITVH